MERTIRNFNVAAAKVKYSLSLGLSLYMTIITAAARDTRTASKGFTEVIISIFTISID